MLKTLVAAVMMPLALAPASAGQMADGELNEAIYGCMETEPGYTDGSLATTKAICIDVIEALVERINSKNCNIELIPPRLQKS